jgi:voltage-gated potassium channel
MTAPDQKIRYAFLLMISLMAIGTLGYMLLEGYSPIDALFMTVITLGTVGYREVAPLSDAGKVFTILLIVGGIGTVAWALGQSLEYFINALAVRRRRMERSIARLDNHVIICGYGRIGRQVAANLRQRGAAFVVVEQDPDVVASLDADGIFVVDGNATDDDALRRARIGEATTVVATLPTNADNVYVVLSARTLNPGIRIVARASDAASAQKLQQAGADKVISPYEIGGRYIANVVMRPHVVNFMDVVNAARDEASANLEIEELEVTPQCGYANVSLRRTNIRSELNIIVLAVRKPDGDFEYNPSPDTVLTPGSMLICIGMAANLDRLARELGHQT